MYTAKKWVITQKSWLGLRGNREKRGGGGPRKSENDRKVRRSGLSLWKRMFCGR